MYPNVAIIQTGGTIASEQNMKSERYGLKPTPGRSGIGEIAGIEVELFNLMSKDSSKIGDLDRIRIGQKTAEELIKGRSVVITHGTDTLQDTACLLNYNLVYNPRRVTLTGALYPRGSERYDGDRNLQGSVIFCAKGKEFSGTFVFMGGYVIYPEFWGKNLYRFHDPVIQTIQRMIEEREKKSVRGYILKKLMRYAYPILPEPFDPFAIVYNGDVRLRHHENPFFLEVDGHFTVKKGYDGKVRALDRRGPTPFEEERKDLHPMVLERSKKMRDAYKFLLSYSELKHLAVNNERNRLESIDEMEKYAGMINTDGTRFIGYWKDFSPYFDDRCQLKRVHIFGDASSDLSQFIDDIGGNGFAGFVMRGWGFGHVNTDDKETVEFLEACEKGQIPIAITTAEGIIVSDEYEVARKLIHKYGGIPSGTLSDKEAQVRLASIVSDPKKRIYIERTAKEYGLKYLDIVRAYYVGGLLFKTPFQRLRYEKKFKIPPTNLDVAASPLFTFEEKIQLLAACLSYLH